MCEHCDKRDKKPFQYAADCPKCWAHWIIHGLYPSRRAQDIALRTIELNHGQEFKDKVLEEMAELRRTQPC